MASSKGHPKPYVRRQLLLAKTWRKSKALAMLFFRQKLRFGPERLLDGTELATELTSQIDARAVVHGAGAFCYPNSFQGNRSASQFAVALTATTAVVPALNPNWLQNLD